METRNTSSLQIAVIVGTLLLFGVGIALYKNIFLGIPLLPGQRADVWTLESKISFRPNAHKTEAILSLPSSEGGWQITDEHFTSSGYQLTIYEDQQPAKAIWRNSGASKPAQLYYKLQLFKDEPQKLDFPANPKLSHLELSESQYQIFNDILLHAREQKKPDVTLTSVLFNQLNENPDYDIDLLLDASKNPRLESVQAILTLAKIPSQAIRGVYLEDGRRKQHLSSLLAVFEMGDWHIYDPTTGKEGMPDNFFIWLRGDNTILDVVGGRNSNLEFAIVKNSLSLKAMMQQNELAGDELVMDFSIYSLPVEQQGIFKKLLLIPVGALVVALLRIVVGIRTSGTFMPILISLALIETTLLTGLLIFLLIVSIGLWIRSYLSYLNLLLVARVASAVVLVILLMVALSIGSYKLGIDQALTVTFFPIIILAWTIERMSILWEEEGMKEVLLQGGGSLLAAVVIYFVISNKYVEHLTFNFPELLVSLLGLIILIGSYSGYRLMELYRFREFKSFKK